MKDSDQFPHRCVPTSLPTDSGTASSRRERCCLIISAIVPFYTAGYQLQFAVLTSGITPYLVYGLVVYWLRRPITIVAGALLLSAHFGLVVHERFIKGADYSDHAIYVVPLVFAALLVPLLVVAMRQPWRE